MDARVTELRADRLLLERIEAHLLARYRDPLAGEKREERVFHSLGRIFFQRLVQDPGVISVAVKSELRLFFHRRNVFFGDPINHPLERLHIGGITFPFGVFHSARGRVFSEETVVALHPVLSVNR
jgi:hypothetical protein